MRTKYIVYATPLNDLVVVFPECVNHTVMAQALCRNWQTDVISAGFVDVRVIDGKMEVRPWGESVGLKKGVDEFDQSRLEQLFNVEKN